MAGAVLAQAPAPAVEPDAGRWRAWTLTSNDQFRPAAPPSAQATAELQQVRDAIANRTPAQERDVAYWDAGPPSYRWIEIASRELTQRNVSGPLLTRAMALVAVAMHDATIATWDAKVAYNRFGPLDAAVDLRPLVRAADVPSYPSEHAATAAAAAAVLSYLFPSEAGRYQQLAQRAGQSRVVAGANLPSDVAAGLELGRLVAGAVVSRAEDDGASRPFAGTIPTGPGLWTGTNPVQPAASSWTPWVLTSGAEVRLAQPPANNSPEEQQQLELVRARTLDNTTRRIAWVWQASSMTPWLDTISKALFDYRLDDNAPRAARVYALSLVAQHDATIACWDTKYTYWLARPSQLDPAIQTLFANPGHPSYPSGHACAGGAFGRVLAYLFPDEAALFEARAEEAGLSTFHAGVHTRLDVDAGLRQSRQVGDRVVARARGDGAR